jgi:hypothetical protein
MVGMEYRKWSMQHSIFLAIQVGTAGIGCWLWFHLPVPGWAVAILAVVAAAMSIHGDMRDWQKAVWMLLIGLLLIVELRSISKERTDSDARALAARQEQDLAFKRVRDAQDADFNATAGGLETAIAGIQSTLGAANATLTQTSPHADLQYKNIAYVQADGSVSTSPLPASVGESHHMWAFFVNAGDDTASLTGFLGKTYVANPLDREAQKELATRFNRDWKARDQKPLATFSPGTNGISDFTTDPLSGDDVAALLSQRKTIYYLLRFSYSDKHGQWFSDYCFGIQNPGQYFGVSYPCSVHNRIRYKATQP